MEKASTLYMRKKQYNSIDFFKFFASLCIVCIHVMPSSSLHGDGMLFSLLLNTYETVVRSAVPFFFIASSFLLFDRKKTSDHTQVRKQALRMGKMYLLWSAIYLPVSIYGYMFNGTSLIDAILAYVAYFFAVGEHWYSYQLWYLLSSAYSFYAMYLLLKMNWKPWQILVLSTGVFFAVLILTNSLVDGCGRIFTGIFYLSLGMCIAEYREKLAAFRLICIPILIISLVITILTDNVLSKISLYYSFFVFVLRLDLLDSDRYWFLRKSSTIIYYLHMMVFFALTLRSGIENRYSFANLVICIMICCFTCLIVLGIKPIRNSKVVRILFG